MFHARRASDESNCGAGGGADTHFGLRVGSIFILLVGATGGALFPVLVQRSKRISLPGYIFEYVYRLPPSLSSRLIASRFAKYFGSGVIVS
jgi:zinc transporter 1/2/3